MMLKSFLSAMRADAISLTIKHIFMAYVAGQAHDKTSTDGPLSLAWGAFYRLFTTLGALIGAALFGLIGIVLPLYLIAMPVWIGLALLIGGTK